MDKKDHHQMEDSFPYGGMRDDTLHSENTHPNIPLKREYGSNHAPLNPSERNSEEMLPSMIKEEVAGFENRSRVVMESTNAHREEDKHAEDYTESLRINPLSNTNENATPASEDDLPYDEITGQVKFDLCDDTRATVKFFRDEIYVDIRKFPTNSSGTIYPSKKGIMLTREAWNQLKDVAKMIDRGFDKLSNS